MIHTRTSILIACLSLLFVGGLKAQEEGDLLSLLGDDNTTEHVTNAFKSTRVINNQSIEMLGAGTLDFRILHRFGKVNGGAYQFFGLDQATMRLGLDYAVTDNLIVGVGRSNSKKEIDAMGKYRILWQSKGKKNMPISLVWSSGATINTLKEPLSNPDVEVTFARRLAYFHELIIGRKFSEGFSLQLSPMLVHRNIVDNILEPNNLFAVGLGGRYKFTKRVAFVWDYSYVVNQFPGDVNKNPLSIGFDIETGGHVFQLHFSNAVGLNERAYISDSNGNWFKGDIQFGFNLSRVFQLTKKEIK